MFDIFEEHESQVRSYCRKFPVLFAKAKNSELIAADGVRYIDFFNGAGALNYGHNNPYVKKAVMDRDKNYCQLCGSRNHLIVHHLSYEHHGDEWNHKGDLVTLCRGCHENVHKVEYVNKELLHKLGFV